MYTFVCHLLSLEHVILFIFPVSVHIAVKALVYVVTLICIFLFCPFFSGTALPLPTISLSHMRMCIMWSNTSSRRGCWLSTLWTQDV